MNRLLMLSLGISLLLPGKGSSETLDQLIQEAWQNNHAVQASEAAWRANDEFIAHESWWPNPNLKFSLLNLPSGELDFGRTPMSGKRLSLMQKVPFWKTPLKGSRARARARAARAGWESQRWEIRQKVVALFHQINYWQKADTILKKNLDLFNRLVRVARVKYERGNGLEQDVLRAEVERSLLENQLLEINEKLAAARARMIALLGRDSGQVPVIDQVPAWQAHTFDQSALLRQAREQNPRLARLTHTQEHARLSRRLADEDWIPDLALSGYYTWRADVPGDPVQGEDFIGASVGIELPLWFFSRELPAAKSAKSRWQSAQRALRDWEAHLESEIAAVVKKLERQTASVKLYAEKVLPQSRAALDSSLNAYQTGRVDFLTLVTNETMLVRHELDYEKILADYAGETARMEALLGAKLPARAEERSQ